MYDLDDYLHLALHANRNREPHACLGYLMEALRIAPENTQAHYLLAIQHADLGLADRAIDGLTRVLALDGSREVARLQLGLLLIDRARNVEAAEQFVQLRGSVDQALRTLATALLAAIDGELAAACAKIRVGLAEVATEHGLRPLMQEVLIRLERMIQGSAAPEAASVEPQDKRLFMGAYGWVGTKR